MINLLRSITVGLILMAIHCKADYQEVYETVIDRAVGPTTLVGARGTLPQTAPSDTNTVFVAPNGNDADPGTEAQPKLTLDGAAAALGGLLTTIQIIRNAYVGDLVIVVSGNVTLGTNNLQAVEGEVGILESDGLPRIVTVSTGTVNGVLLQGQVGIQLRLTSTGSFENIGLSTDSTATISVLNGATTSNIRYSYGKFQWSPTATGSTLELVNNMLFRQRSTSAVLGISGSANGTGTYTLNMTRCSLVQSVVDTAGGDALVTVTDSGDSAARTYDLNLESSFVASSLPYLIGHNASATGKTITVDESFCYHSGSILAQTVAGSEVTFTFAENDPIDPQTPSLLTNQAALSDQPVDPNNGRLQIAGKATPDGTGTYFITSPLRGAGVAGVDVNPWDETVTGPVPSYGREFTFEIPPAEHEIPHEYVNLAQPVNLNGGVEVDFDGFFRTFRLTWPGGNRDGINRDWQRCAALGKDKGTKAVYLKGETGNWLEASGIENATFDSTDTTIDGLTVDGSFTPTDGVERLLYGVWDMFILEVEVGASDIRHYFIQTTTGDDNDDGKWYIVDKLGQGLPADGIYPVAIRYFWAHTTELPVPRFNHVIGFEKGNELAPYKSAQDPDQPDQDADQAKNYALVCMMQPDPRPNRV